MSQLSCVVQSATLRGVHALPVSVEVVISSGIPSFSIVGMPDAAIQESRERVRVALRACGFVMPSDKIVVNLAPGSIRKTGSGFDLPIAMALLVATSQISKTHIENTLIVGELSLDGTVRCVRGLLAYQHCAAEQGMSLLTGNEDAHPLSLEGLACFGIDTLSNLRRQDLKAVLPAEVSATKKQLDYADVKGNLLAKRAFQIAAAGNHGILMVGSPGSGKTMLAQRFGSILPDLTEKEIIESALVYSVVGEDLSDILSGVRPFRAPHHSATSAGLLGGGSPIRPGEISLAHNGVLFLDELAEFKPSVLQGLRQPLEEGVVRLTRAEGTYEMPSSFMLVAAMNPCPCGHFGDPYTPCQCSEYQIRLYQNRIGGPLLDRIDIRIDVWRTPYEQIFTDGPALGSEDLRTAVLAAREYRSWRVERDALTSSGQGSVSELMNTYHLTDEANDLARTLADTQNMSARSIIKMLSIARTIADMNESFVVEKESLAEAYVLRFQGGDQ